MPLLVAAMADVGFYIDTAAKGEGGEEEEKEEILTQNREVLGALDAATEKKPRERAAQERGLASFLLGKVSDIFFTVKNINIVISVIPPSSSSSPTCSSGV